MEDVMATEQPDALSEVVANAIFHAWTGWGYRPKVEAIEPELRQHAGMMGRAALAAIPDGWAKVDGEWFRIKSVDVETRHDGTFSYYTEAD